MEITAIDKALRELFAAEHRIVFWLDPDVEFEDTVSDIDLEGVEVINIGEIGALEVKVRVEIDRPTDKFLLYAPLRFDHPADNWLRDIQLYSQNFRADRASLMLRELGLDNQSLAQHIKRRATFFRSKKRISALKRLVSQKDTPEGLDRKMLSVIVGAGQAETFLILRTLLHKIMQSEDRWWQRVEKLGLVDSFWDCIAKEFGYVSDMPSIDDLVSRLFISELGILLRTDLPKELQELPLPDAGARNATVFLAQWRDSNKTATSYNGWADRVWNRLEIDLLLESCGFRGLAKVTTFDGIEEIVVTGLVDLLQEIDTPDLEAVQEICKRRKSSHWVLSPSVARDRREAHAAIYDALSAAAELLSLQHTYADLYNLDGEAMYRRYESELFRIDQLYRHVCFHINQATGHDLLKPVQDRIDKLYCDGFLTAISEAWGKHITKSLPHQWSLGPVLNQHTFYVDNVAPWLLGGPKRRAFVIISDALRYEAAEELARKINGLPRISAKLSSQLGVLPSYTTLGMASLLPHNKISYEKKGQILVDGLPAASLKQRNAILEAYNGKAIKATELLKMTRKEGRAFIAGTKVVYIYHNEVDAIGDFASTESQTFKAVKDAIHTLKKLAQHIVNALNGSYVVITSDHGFLYTDTAPEPSTLEGLPKNLLVTAKKRYALGKSLPQSDRAWQGTTHVTAKTSGDMDFLIPKGYTLFNFQGGARFFHGGAMLQEIAVPVIKVREKGSKDPKGQGQRSVNVEVIGHNFRITTNKHRFTLLQTEAVKATIKPVTLTVAIYEDACPVTDIQTITFSSTSNNPKDREKSVVLTLRHQPYDKRTAYQLMLRNVETGVRTQEVPVIIDRAIIDDF